MAAPGFATAPVTFTIISVAAVVYALGLVSPDLQWEMVRRFASVNLAIDAGEWWRIFTAAFLHGGLMHILFNMYALYLFGPRLESQVGSVPFALLYAASAAGGGAASYLFGPDFIDAASRIPYTAVGASGAIFGLFGAWMYVAYQLRSTPAGRAMFNQLGVLLLINLALPLFIPNIDWRAHVGGLVTGIAIAALWGRFARGRQDVVRRRTVLAAAVLVLLVVLVITL